MKKIYYFLFIFCLLTGFCLGFNTKPSKAAIIPPEFNNNIPYSREEYNKTISEYSLFNSFDYSYLDKINVDIHLKSNNFITTNVVPTEETITTYSGNCFGNLCFQQKVYLIQVNMYLEYSGGTYRIYYNSLVDTTLKTLNYSTTTCNTVSYINNTISTTKRNLYLLFTNQNNYQYTVETLYSAYESNIDLVIGSGNSQSTAINNLEYLYDAKLLYNSNTSLTNSTSSINSTCNSLQTIQYDCLGNLNETYLFDFYNIKLGSINLNKKLNYQDNKCVISSIGTSPLNYYSSYVVDFKSLDNTSRRNIWNSLTQINGTSNFDYSTLSIGKATTNGNVISGIDIDFRLELVFSSNINYEYNNAYFKFDTNSSATLTNFYYGIFDLMLNYSTNNTYTVALLNESSIINSNNLILISDIEMISGVITFDYNFNISYLSDVLIDQIGFDNKMLDCKWYQFMCHVDNFFTKTIYSIPVLSDFYSMFTSMLGTISTIIDLFVEYKEIQFIGTVVILSLCYHFIKRSIE